MEQLKTRIEAVLFTTAQALSIKEIAEISITPRSGAGVYEIRGRLNTYGENETFYLKVPLSNEVVAKILNAYPPLKQSKDGIDFYYYADRENRFAGCFYASGFWVSSYNKQLLECVQEQLEYTFSTISTSQKEEPKDISNLPSINKLSGSVSLIWYDGYQWMNTDITLLPDCLSFFSVLPISRSADSSEMVMADTFRLRFSNYLHLPMDSLALQYSSDEESLYVTVSIKD